MKKIVLIQLIFVITVPLRAQQLVQSILYDFIDSSGTHPYGQTVYNYDTTGNITSFLNFHWDTTKQTWINDYTENRYYSFNKLNYKQTKNLNYNNTIMVNGCKTIYSYDSLGREDTILSQNWNYQGYWQNHQRHIYSYNAAGLISEVEEQQIWNASIWECNNKYLYSYKPGGLLDYSIIQYPNFSINPSAWINMYKLNYSYNSANKCILQQGFPLSVNSLGSPFSIVMIYDSNNFLIEQKEPPYWRQTYTNNPDGSIYQSFYTQSWGPIGTTRATYFYTAAHTLSVASEIKKQEKIIAYPNPTSSILILTFESSEKRKLKVMDLLGEIVTERNLINQQVELDIAAFKPGIYIFEIESEEGIFRKKIIKN